MKINAIKTSELDFKQISDFNHRTKLKLSTQEPKRTTHQPFKRMTTPWSTEHRMDENYSKALV
jgi:hypothetical protein